MLPKFTTADIAAPFIAHAPTSPTVSAQRIEALPTPLKSPVSATFHPAWHSTENLGRQDLDGRSVYFHQPDSNVVGGILKQNVGGAVAIEVADADNLPTQRHRTQVDCLTGPQVVEFKLTLGFEHSINQTPTSPVVILRRKMAPLLSDPATVQPAGTAPMGLTARMLRAVHEHDSTNCRSRPERGYHPCRFGLNCPVPTTVVVFGSGVYVVTFSRSCCRSSARRRGRRWYRARGSS